MSEKKDSCHIHGTCKRHKLYRRLFAAFLLLLILVALVILIIWLVLRPTKPKYYLQDASVAHLNLSYAGLLTSVIQVTISSRNPNDRIGIYYDRLVTYAQYQGQQITASTLLPTGYQGHNDVTVWSPYLYGAAVPLAPYLADAISQDLHAGYLLLYVRVDGQLRWKVGTWTSGTYHIHVKCPAFLALDSGKPKDGDGSYYFRFQQMSACSVDV
ncbi:hypothetical protein Cni_G13242 [Canna indica]|uniref:Late embryogenesis abundant protein LEA-2 subgroup domain-containing protein n=1 Tax=Canna indica TaxID=4628 RepID=A0AAQ3Q9P4_9LILI|nr:hypothetical protein Cni_G13242 [Canna indica]